MIAGESSSTSSSTSASDNQWFYTVVLKDREKSEDTMSRKGPMPQIVLVRLLEKGIIGPTAESATLVWKIGMDEWLPIQTVRISLPFCILFFYAFYNAFILEKFRYHHLNPSSTFKISNGITLIMTVIKKVQFILEISYESCGSAGKSTGCLSCLVVLGI